MDPPVVLHSTARHKQPIGTHLLVVQIGIIDTGRSGHEHIDTTGSVGDVSQGAVGSVGLWLSQFPDIPKEERRTKVAFNVGLFEWFNFAGKDVFDAQDVGHVNAARPQFIGGVPPQGVSERGLQQIEGQYGCFRSGTHGRDAQGAGAEGFHQGPENVYVAAVVREIGDEIVEHGVRLGQYGQVVPCRVGFLDEPRSVGHGIAFDSVGRSWCLRLRPCWRD